MDLAQHALSRRREQRGSVIAEALLAIPILLFFVVAAYNFARGHYLRQQASTAARVAAFGAHKRTARLGGHAIGTDDVDTRWNQRGFARKVEVRVVDEGEPDGRQKLPPAEEPPVSSPLPLSIVVQEILNLFPMESQGREVVLSMRPRTTGRLFGRSDTPFDRIWDITCDNHVVLDTWCSDDPRDPQGLLLRALERYLGGASDVLRWLGAL